MPVDPFIANRDAFRLLDTFDATEPMVIYILHIEMPDGSVDHYIGSTFRARLRRRMQAHANGYGSSYTRRVTRQGARLYLVGLTADDDRSMEVDLHRHPDLPALCCFCTTFWPVPSYAGRLVPTAPAPGVAAWRPHSIP